MAVKYDPILKRLRELDASGGGGTGDAVVQTNTLTVEPTSPVVVGKIYDTYAGALAYAQSQTPANTNRWVINLPAGDFAEAVTIDDYISVVGHHEGTRITGAVDCTATFTGDLFVGNIHNCVINDLDISVTGTITVFIDCRISGGAPTAGAGTIIFMLNSFIQGGDFSGYAGVLRIEECVVFGGIFPSIFQAQDTDFSTNPPGATLNGGDFQRCVLESGSNTYNAGTYNLYNCDLRANISTGTGSWTLIGGITDGATITYDTGGSLDTYGVANLTVVDNGGVFNNRGDFYDNSTSGLTATNTQEAIDEIANVILNVVVATSLNYAAAFTEKVILIDTTSNNVTVDLPTASGNAGRHFWIKAIEVINTATVDPNGAETIDGASTYVFSTKNEAIHIVAHNGVWRII